MDAEHFARAGELFDQKHVPMDNRKMHPDQVTKEQVAKFFGDQKWADVNKGYK